MKRQSLLLAQVSPIMVTHGSNYSRNYACPKAQSRQKSFSKENVNGGHIYRPQLLTPVQNIHVRLNLINEKT
jgi:hypothetical protein